jgi:uncharacterized protein YidB (DUF937 family)
MNIDETFDALRDAGVVAIAISWNDFSQSNTVELWASEDKHVSVEADYVSEAIAEATESFIAEDWDKQGIKIV